MAQLKSTNVTGNLSVTGNILASKIIKLGGTEDELLLASGSVITKTQLQAAITSNTWRPVKYDTTTLTDSSTTLEFAAGSNIGLTFTGGKLTIANNYSYSLPLAANGTRGGIQIGYTSTENNRALLLDSEKAYIALPSRLYAGRTDSTAPDAATKSGFYYSAAFPASVGFGSNQGTMFVSSYSDDWVAQIAIGCYTNKMIFRKKGSGWSDWETVATESWVTDQLGSGGSYDVSKVSVTAEDAKATRYLTFVDDHATKTQSLKVDDDIYYASDSNYNWSSLNVGKSTKNGILTLHRYSGTSDKYVNLKVKDAVTTNYDVFMPPATGTIATQEWVGNNMTSASNSKITITASGKGLSGTDFFTLNQSSAKNITLTLDSSTAGNRTAEQVVIATAKGQINSMKYAITNDGGAVKATWQYNASTDCVELMWA